MAIIIISCISAQSEAKYHFTELGNAKMDIEAGLETHPRVEGYLEKGMCLSEEEIKLINNHRAQRAQKTYLAKARRRALHVALQYGLWLARRGRGSSFSTFVNEFGYEDRDCSEMFRVVENILSAADEIQLTDQPPYDVLKPF